MSFFSRGNKDSKKDQEVSLQHLITPPPTFKERFSEARTELEQKHHRGGRVLTSQDNGRTILQRATDLLKEKKYEDALCEFDKWIHQAQSYQANRFHEKAKQADAISDDPQSEHKYLVERLEGIRKNLLADIKQDRPLDDVVTHLQDQVRALREERKATLDYENTREGRYALPEKSEINRHREQRELIIRAFNNMPKGTDEARKARREKRSRLELMDKHHAMKAADAAFETQTFKSLETFVNTLRKTYTPPSPGGTSGTTPRSQGS